MSITSNPELSELLEFFESEPVYQDTSSHHYAYQYTDNFGITIIFAFCLTAGWMQTMINYHGQEITRYLSEGVDSFKLLSDQDGVYIHSEINFEGNRTQVEIRIKPFICVRWGTLVR